MGIPREELAQVAPESQVGAELNRLCELTDKAEDVFESLRLGISPILREDPKTEDVPDDEVTLSAPRAREIQSIRMRLERLIQRITDTSGLSEA